MSKSIKYKGFEIISFTYTFERRGYDNEIDEVTYDTRYKIQNDPENDSFFNLDQVKNHIDNYLTPSGKRKQAWIKRLEDELKKLKGR